MTPIVKFVVRGYDIFTVDNTGAETIVGVGDTPELASWIGQGLAWAHNVPLEVDEG